MIADAVESATRSMVEPTAGRVEALVRDLTLKRFHDGQLEDSGLTMGDLVGVQRSLVRSLLGIYHGRIAYPSTASVTSAPMTSAPTLSGPRSATAG